MGYTIAVSGKGGTGKSTVSALMVRCIMERFDKATLAVDADPNFTLGPLLGVDVEETIADLRDDVVEKRMDIPAGVPKDRQIEYCIQKSIVERSKFDLLTMGRPEGPNCYCYVNNLLRKHLDRAQADYPFTVIDNEAGMEHLSRRTTNNVDLMVIVSEATMPGVLVAERIRKMTSELPIEIRRILCVVNRVGPEGVPPVIRDAFESRDIEIAAELEFDQEIQKASVEGKSLLDISSTNGMYKSVCVFLTSEINTVNTASRRD